MNNEKDVMTKKDYVKKIFIVVGVTAVGVTLIALGMKNKSLKLQNAAIMLASSAGKTVTLVKEELPLDFNVGRIHDLWEGGSFTNATICDLKLADVGRLGEELLKITGVNADSRVQVMVDIQNK